MIANIFKTVGLCLTSLNSFNIQKDNEIQITDETLNIQYQNQQEVQNLGSDIFELMPITWSMIANKTNITEYGTVKSTWISCSTYIDIQENQTFVNTYNNYRFTYAMQLIKIENAPNLKYNTYLNEINAYTSTAEDTNFNINVYTAIQNIGQTDNIINMSISELNSYLIPKDSNVNLYNSIFGNNNISQWNNILTETTTKNGRLRTIHINWAEDPVQLPTAYNNPLYIAIVYTVDDAEGTDKLSDGRYEIQRYASTYTASITIEQTIIPNNINYEVIDLPNLMFTVLGMPFTFISTAFNLTVFPGTPYQLNLSALFLAILGLLFFVFIVSIIKGKIK